MHVCYNEVPLSTVDDPRHCSLSTEKNKLSVISYSKLHTIIIPKHTRSTPHVNAGNLQFYFGNGKNGFTIPIQIRWVAGMATCAFV